jgi:hypothetical protein
MSKIDFIDKAREMALSCRRCGSPTDVEFKEESAIWKTRCECGKTDEHLIEEIAEEIKELAEQFKRADETVFRNNKKPKRR